ncbi:hypothetical protein FHS15_002884 [Paenibacillus castaneae]|uniref:hypothetical protein n=1 Tax=Paenibacillus castaneae TaxID=474957 RepID=UPI000C9CB540|nr:hypothetical protein [Paenibacillus castaneae]NIK77746.1 hypothetical protein [Paenibacillus castaneae]
MYNYYVERQTVPHPVVVEARQVAANQILVTYDQRADVASATNISNYWIRSNMGPDGVASVGMSDALSASNSIRPEMGMIMPADNSKMRFLMTFSRNVTPGSFYIVLPCFVSLEGNTGYTGGNWGPLSRNMFFGM